MIANIIDKRTNSLNTKCCVVVEDAYHDNTISNASKFPEESVIDYEDFVSVNVCDVILYLQQTHATTPNAYFTLYLYDEGSANHDHQSIVVENGKARVVKLKNLPN